MSYGATDVDVVNIASTVSLPPPPRSLCFIIIFIYLFAFRIPHNNTVSDSDAVLWDMEGKKVNKNGNKTK